MNNKHAKILSKLFIKPPLSSITWQDVESLFIGLGAKIEEGRGSRVHVLLNDEVATFHRPHPKKETDKGAVVSVRRFLIQAGVKP